jgi:hypothetical protein
MNCKLQIANLEIQSAGLQFAICNCGTKALSLALYESTATREMRILIAAEGCSNILSMATGLLTAVLFGLVTQAVTIYYGYRVPRPGAFVRHFSFALASTFLLSFAHSMTMFFFIGTGKHIKELVKEHGLGQEIIHETILFKNKLFPVMMIAISLVLAQFILGGGTDTRVVPAWIHHVMAWVTFVSNGYCLALEAKYLASNSRLMNSVYRAVDR